MAERPPIDYEAIKADRALGLNDQQLAKKYGVADKTLRRTRARDAAAGHPWPDCGAGADNAPDRGVAAPRASSEGSKSDPDTSAPPLSPRASITLLPGGKRGRDRAPTSHLEIDLTGPAPDEHELLDLAMRGAKRLWTRYNDGRLEPGQNQSEADLVQRMAVATTALVHAKREADGLKTGQASGKSEVDPDANLLIIETRKLEPKIIAVNERGRAIPA